MVGDEAVLPAMPASLARIPDAVPVDVLVEVDGPDDEIALATPGDLRLTRLHRRGGTDDLVADAVRALDFPDGTVHAFVHGEAAAGRAVRRPLLVDPRHPARGAVGSGYRKRDRTEEGWREDKAEWNRQVEEDAA